MKGSENVTIIHLNIANPHIPIYREIGPLVSASIAKKTARSTARSTARRKKTVLLYIYRR